MCTDACTKLTVFTGIRNNMEIFLYNWRALYEVLWDPHESSPKWAHKWFGHFAQFTGMLNIQKYRPWYKFGHRVHLFFATEISVMLYKIFESPQVFNQNSIFKFNVFHFTIVVVMHELSCKINTGSICSYNITKSLEIIVK